MDFVKERTPCNCDTNISITNDGGSEEKCMSCGKIIFNSHTHLCYLKCNICDHKEYGEFSKIRWKNFCSNCGK